jgi:hypothetical protein
MMMLAMMIPQTTRTGAVAVVPHTQRRCKTDPRP